MGGLEVDFPDRERNVDPVNSDLIETLGLAEDVFAGRVALVTGSASGIGEATARALAFLGAKIVLVDRQDDKGRAVANSIQDAGGQAVYLRCDLSRPDEISRLIPRAQAAFGPVDILINSAVHVSVAPLVAYDLEEWEYTVAVNARAPFLLTKALLPDMLANGAGTLVNVVAYEGSPLAAIYAATKSATRSMARSVAQEVPDGVPVYAFSFVPGVVDTPLIHDVLLPQMSQVMGLPVHVLLAGLAQNPGYPGLVPPDHCAAALVYCLAHAEEYNAQVADPFDPLRRFGVIDVPKLEAEDVRAMDVAGAVSQDVKLYLQGLSDLNHDLEKRIEVRTHELEMERARSESLLLNILPREVAQILKERTGTIAQRFDQASVLFADMVGFTPLSAEMTPEEMVELLNTIYSFYDSLTEKYGLEKIRTIGDNYMVASGLPRPRPDHAQALARMALDMRDYFRDPGRLGVDGLSFRIGINSGPLVAGVIGQKKFQYDIWGPTVNTASRMESQGLPGKVQITQATCQLLEDEFICEPRGTLDVKGVGNVETWFLVAEKDEARRT